MLKREKKSPWLPFFWPFCTPESDSHRIFTNNTSVQKEPKNQIDPCRAETRFQESTLARNSQTPATLHGGLPSSGSSRRLIVGERAIQPVSLSGKSVPVKERSCCPSFSRRPRERGGDQKERTPGSVGVGDSPVVCVGVCARAPLGSKASPER